MATNNFWTSPQLEPKRKFRWLLSFAGAPQFIIKSVTKPSFSVGSSTHNFLQHQFNFPGRVTWQDISITLVDPVNPDATASLYSIIGNAGYVVPDQLLDGPTGRRTISKKGMVSALGNFIKIDQISAESSAEVIESWRINNPQITNVSFDSLDYGSDDGINITVGIKYDWAELNPDEASVVTDGGWQVYEPGGGESL